MNELFRTGGISNEQRLHSPAGPEPGAAAHHGVDTLDEILSTSGHRVDAVVCLQADEDELVERLLRGGREQGRTDDTEQTIRVRLAVYSQQTAPFIETYRNRGLLAEVDGLGAIGVVSTRIYRSLSTSGC